MISLTQIPHSEENYLAPWAVQPDWWEQQILRVRGLDLKLHIHQNAEQVRAELERVRGGYAYDLDGNGIAVVELRGSTTKYYNSFSGGTATLFARKTIEAVRRSPDVRGVLLVIDSPGGSVSGQRDFADAVARLAQEKPLVAYAEDLAASAAYWTASQATEIYSNPTASVGSIGTFGVLYDTSKMFEEAGVRALIFRSGKFKGVGTPGVEVSEEAQAKFQDLVETLNGHFLDAVAAGRKMPMDRVKTLATGELWIGEAAAANGLTDGVLSIEAAYDRLLILVEEKEMSESKTENKAATIQELRAACPGADSDFLLKQLDAGATAAEAKDAWLAEQNVRLQQHRDELTKSQEAHKKAEQRAEQLAKVGASGVDGVPAPDAGGGSTATDFADPAAAWETAIAEQLKSGRAKTRQQATTLVCREQPELRKAYVAAHNQAHPNHDGRGED